VGVWESAYRSCGVWCSVKHLVGAETIAADPGRTTVTLTKNGEIYVSGRKVPDGANLTGQIADDLRWSGGKVQIVADKNAAGHRTALVFAAARRAAAQVGSQAPR
jgi:hypothetical protein